MENTIKTATPDDAQLVDINVPSPDPANTRRNHDVEGIAASIRRFGQRDAIELQRGTNRITKGEGTWKACKLVGLDKVFVVYHDLDDLGSAQYSIANNRLAERSEWDPAALLSIVEVTGDDIPGVDDEFLEQMKIEVETVGENTQVEPPDDPGAEMDRFRELRERWKVEFGQLWEIPSTTNEGKVHRLMCGDATSPAMVTALMDGQRAVLFATDPPYLVDYDGNNHPSEWGKKDKNKNWSELYTDWDKAEGAEGLYEGFISVAVNIAITEDAAWYCWHASKKQAHLEKVWEENGAFVHQQIIWAKDRAVLTHSWYMWQHEPCFFGWIKGKRPKRCAEDHPTTVWNLPTIPPGQTTDHPTAKNPELFAIPIKQHTRRGEICYEPFCGSGTQMAAAEQLGRVCYAMEKCPEFVAVILERMSKMGLEPRLFEGQSLQ